MLQSRSQLSDRKSEERRFHEYEQSAAMCLTTRRMQQLIASVENTGDGLKFAATRKTYDAKGAEATPNGFIRHFETLVGGSIINLLR